MLNVISQECLFVVLSQQSTVSKVLKETIDTVEKNGDYHVIIDLSRVMLLLSKHISQLIHLHKTLQDKGKRLILCNVPFQIKCELRVVSLSGVLEFSQDKFSAMDALQITPSSN